MQQRDAIRRVLARLRELEGDPRYSPLYACRSCHEEYSKPSDDMGVLPNGDLICYECLASENDDAEYEAGEDGVPFVAVEAVPFKDTHSLTPILAALAQAVVEAPVLLPARRYMERTPALDAALDALAKEEHERA